MVLELSLTRVSGTMEAAVGCVNASTNNEGAQEEHLEVVGAKVRLQGGHGGCGIGGGDKQRGRCRPNLGNGRERQGY